MPPKFCSKPSTASKAVEESEGTGEKDCLTNMNLVLHSGPQPPYALIQADE